MNLPQAIAFIGTVFILCAVLAPLLFSDMPSFRYGITLGDVLDVLVRLAIFGLFIELLRRLLIRN